MAQIPLTTEVILKATYGGNINYMESDQELELQFNSYTNELSISLQQEITLIQGQHNIIKFKLTNSGNSSLQDVQIQYIGAENGELINSSLQDLIFLSPNDEYSFNLDIFDSDINQEIMNVTISITAISYETQEVVVVEETFLFNVNPTNTIQLRNFVLLGAFAIGTAGLWMYGAKYMKNKRKEINAPLATRTDLPKKKQRRTGKYVNISDLKKEKPKSDDTKGEVTTLDDLLEEDKEE
jgi:hypothetical protein